MVDPSWSRSLLEMIGETGKQSQFTPAPPKKKFTHQRDHSLKVRLVSVYVVGPNTRNKNKIKMPSTRKNRSTIFSNQASSQTKARSHSAKTPSDSNSPPLRASPSRTACRRLRRMGGRSWWRSRCRSWSRWRRARWRGGLWWSTKCRRRSSSDFIILHWWIMISLFCMETSNINYK